MLRRRYRAQYATSNTQRPTPSDSAAGETTCVVTSHAYGRFLPACLDSLLAQSSPFRDVILVDDASTDDTPAVAARYPVTYLRGEWRNPAHARNAGLADADRSRYVLCVDADNWLPPDYHARLREGMDAANVGLVYPALWPHNEAGLPEGEPYLPGEPEGLRNRNCADTCSLVRWDALEQAGGWPSTPHAQDWALALRLSRLGWRLRPAPAAVLRYRRHGASLTVRYGPDAAVMADALAVGSLVAVVTLFSGREWALPGYFASLAALDWPREGLHLVAVDNSRDPLFGVLLRARLADSGLPYTYVEDLGEAVPGEAATVVADSAKLRAENDWPINRHLARLYARARSVMPSGADLVLAWEDDIEPEPAALRTLAAELCQHQRAGVVAASVVNRFGGRLLAWDGTRHLTTPPAVGESRPVDATGFMWTLFRREAWDELAFHAGRWEGDGLGYYDWAAAHDVRMAGHEWRVTSARCGHRQAEGGVLWP